MKNNRIKATLAFSIILLILILSAIWYRNHLIDEMKKQVTELLIDPSSATFEDVRLFGDWTVKGGALCGKVNAKNRMGGYVGYRYFVVIGGHVNIFSEEEQNSRISFNMVFCSPEKAPAPWWHLR